MLSHPKKSEAVYVEQLEQELCVYDWQRAQMHALNPTAALVWNYCDGETSPAHMADRLESDLDLPDAKGLVLMSLDRLDKANLLDKASANSQKPGQAYTRRELLKVVGVSLALLPVVSSLALPSPTQAQSCVDNCSFGTNFFSSEDCNIACNDQLLSFEALCSVEQISSTTCNCSVFTTDLAGSGCVVPTSLGQNNRVR